MSPEDLGNSAPAAIGGLIGGFLAVVRVKAWVRKLIDRIEDDIAQQRNETRETLRELERGLRSIRHQLGDFTNPSIIVSDVVDPEDRTPIEPHRRRR